jgi:hypothetical protein
MDLEVRLSHAERLAMPESHLMTDGSQHETVTTQDPLLLEPPNSKELLDKMPIEAIEDRIAQLGQASKGANGDRFELTNNAVCMLGHDLRSDRDRKTPLRYIVLQKRWL